MARAREGADGRERQAEEDDERRDERAQGQHHHDVDDEDGEAHREVQSYSKASFISAVAPANVVSMVSGICPSSRRSSMRAAGFLGRGAGVCGDDLGADGRGRRAVHSRHRGCAPRPHRRRRPVPSGVVPAMPLTGIWRRASTLSTPASETRICAASEVPSSSVYVPSGIAHEHAPDVGPDLGGGGADHHGHVGIDRDRSPAATRRPHRWRRCRGRPSGAVRRRRGHWRP